MMLSQYTVNERLERFKTLCREAGLRLTPQKVAVFKALAETDEHPTAQDLFEAVREDYPTISFATVYDNLRKFKELQLVQEMNTGEGAARYDANIEHHHHIIDTKTGKLMDVCLPEISKIPLPKEIQGKPVKDIKITYYI